MIRIFNLKPTLKIILTAFFIAIVIITSKLIPISNIFSLPFLRISLGPTILIFASILLGPIYGGIAGFLSDSIGFLFDMTGGAYNPLFSLTYFLYGLLPGLFILLLRKNKSKFPITQIVLFVLINVFVICFFSLSNSITPYGGKSYEITDAVRYAVIFTSLGITILYFIIYIILYRKFKTDEKRILLNNISIINFIVLIIVQLGVGVGVKYITYQVDVLVLIGAQIFVTTIEILLANYINVVLYEIANRIFKNNNIECKKKPFTKNNFKEIFAEELSNIRNKNK